MSEPMPDDVARAFEAMPPHALALRAAVLDVAAGLGLARPEETLKLGEPACLPGKGGTTVRIGPDKAGGGVKLLVNCRTSLVEDWRARFDGRLEFEGDRAVLVPASGRADEAAFRACIADAFTYHDAKRKAAHG